MQTIHMEWRELEQFGIVFLTGEANGITGIPRLLCDLTENGKEIIADFFGIYTDGFRLNWNNGSSNDPHIASILIPASVLCDLIIFCYLQKYDYVLLLSYPSCGSFYVATNDIDVTMKKYSDCNQCKIEQRFYKAGTGKDKTRNVHEFSGRED